MVATNYLLPARLHEYLLKVSLREPEIVRRLREETATHPKAFMHVVPEAGQFLGFLVELIGARRVLELGTFTGYSALWMALAMPEDGRLVACDANEEALVLARRYWALAGVDERIELRIGQVADALVDIYEAYGPDSFDFAFIDADKPGYRDYYEKCLELVRPGGLIAADNVLFHGTVSGDAPRRKYTDDLVAFNDLLATDERISLTVIPIGDGIALARRRG
jgi:predicted O-methyltransferase YrrM